MTKVRRRGPPWPELLVNLVVCAFGVAYGIYYQSVLGYVIAGMGGLVALTAGWDIAARSRRP
jgi:hypothetical protein